MKTAEQWAEEAGRDNIRFVADEIAHRRAIQADALRHAANLFHADGGESVNEKVFWIRQLAHELEQKTPA